MHVSYGNRLATVCSRAAAVAVLAVAATGCAKFGKMPSWVPFQKKSVTAPDGIVSPRQRIEQLQKLAKEAGRADENRQRAIVGELAQGIRTEKDPMVRAETIRAAGAIFNEEAKAVLRAALSDPDGEVRIAACEAWGKREDAEAATLLGGIVSGDIDLDVRLAATRALGNSKNPAAVGALGEALEDKDPAMQYRAVLSLRKVTGKDFGNDVDRWRQYVRGELPESQEPASIAERIRQTF